MFGHYSIDFMAKFNGNLFNWLRFQLVVVFIVVVLISCCFHCLSFQLVVVLISCCFHCCCFDWLLCWLVVVLISCCFDWLLFGWEGWLNWLFFIGLCLDLNIASVDCCFDWCVLGSKYPKYLYTTPEHTKLRIMINNLQFTQPNFNCSRFPRLTHFLCFLKQAHGDT